MIDATQNSMEQLKMGSGDGNNNNKKKKKNAFGSSKNEVYSKDEKEIVSSQLKCCVTLIEKQPKFPSYRTPHDRLASYSAKNAKWQYGGEDSKDMCVDNMVRAGFYYTGIRDKVRCYYCGLGLVSWWRSDNPFIIHAERSPNCPHLIISFGKKIISEIAEKKGNKGNISSSESPQMPPDEKKMEYNPEDECAVCKNKERSILIYPCLHLVACDICALSCGVCPACRAEITGLQRAYDEI